MRQRQGQPQQQQFAQASTSGNTIATIVSADQGHPQSSHIIQQHQPQTILIPQTIASTPQSNQQGQQIYVQAVPGQQHQIQYTTSNGSIVVQNVPQQQPQQIYVTAQPQHTAN